MHINLNLWKNTSFTFHACKKCSSFEKMISFFCLFCLIPKTFVLVIVNKKEKINSLSAFMLLSFVINCVKNIHTHFLLLLVSTNETFFLVNCNNCQIIIFHFSSNWRDLFFAFIKIHDFKWEFTFSLTSTMSWFIEDSILYIFSLIFFQFYVLL